MAYVAKVIKIFIASPSDADLEREASVNAIHAWNYAHSESEQVILQPVRWETHSYAASGKHPQEILNGQIVETCDAVIGIFKGKLGTPTSNAESGSVEEINRLKSLGKPISLYFSNELDEGTSPNKDQFKRLQEFKNRCQKTAYYFEYSSAVNFAEKFRQQLPAIVKRVREVVDADLQLDDEVSAANKRLSGSDLSKRQVSILIGAKKGDGYVISSEFIGGYSLGAGSTSIYRGNEQREISAWTEALNDLELQGLLQTSNNQVFQLTSRGYDRADLLSEKI